MNHINDYSIYENLPESLNRKKAKELAQLADRVLHDFEPNISKVLIYPVIDQLDSDMVNALAIQLHCDFYDFNLPLATRRNLVKTSIAWHRIKGTPAAVEMLAQTIFHDSHTKEWFEYGGRPYFFRMVQDISDGREDVTKETLDLLKKAIWMGKNVRSWLEMIEFHVNIEETVEYSEQIAKLSAELKFQDWMPYGQRRGAPDYDGSLCHGGIAYYDGAYYHDGILLYNGIIPGDWPHYHGWDDLSMDELFLASHFSFFDDVSAGGLFHDGSIRYNGEFFYGGADTLPADFGIKGLHFRHRFSDTVPTIKETGGRRLNLKLADIIPYGHRYIVQYDGEGEQGGIACHDGDFAHDDDLSYDSIIPGKIWTHGGKRDLDMDELFGAAHFSFYDDVSESDTMHNGEILHDGRFVYGHDLLPNGERFSVSFHTNIEEAIQEEDRSGSFSVSVNACYQGDFRQDGMMEYGGCSYEDDLSGSLSLLAIDRSGKYCHDGGVEMAADGRLITA